MIMQYATENIIPVSLELGGKSPNIFFGDVMDADDGFLDKALEGFTFFALNQGEVCTCPSRALIQENMADDFYDLAIARALVEHVLEHTLLEHARPDLDPPALERVIGKLHAQRLECRNPAARHSIAGTRRVLPPAAPAPTAGRDAAATSG